MGDSIMDLMDIDAEANSTAYEGDFSYDFYHFAIDVPVKFDSRERIYVPDSFDIERYNMPQFEMVLKPKDRNGLIEANAKYNYLAWKDVFEMSVKEVADIKGNFPSGKKVMKRAPTSFFKYNRMGRRKLRSISSSMKGKRWNTAAKIETADSSSSSYDFVIDLPVTYEFEDDNEAEPNMKSPDDLSFGPGSLTPKPATSQDRAISVIADDDAPPGSSSK